MSKIKGLVGHAPSEPCRSPSLPLPGFRGFTGDHGRSLACSCTPEVSAFLSRPRVFSFYVAVLQGCHSCCIRDLLYSSDFHFTNDICNNAIFN